jgi:hypothetical protein
MQLIKPSQNGATRHAANKLPDILKRDGPFCSLCGLYVIGKDRSVDHILEFRNGGTKDLNNLRMAHIECNAARDDHHILNYLKTLNHLKAIGDLATLLNKYGYKWHFSRMPDNANLNYEVTLFCNSIEVDFCHKFLNKILGLLSGKYGSFYSINLVIDEKTPCRYATNNILDYNNDFMYLTPKDLLRQALEKTKIKYKKNKIGVVIRYMLWQYLKHNEPEIYKEIASKGKLTHD